MRAVIQRAAYGRVSTKSEKIAEIGKGYVVFVGIKRGDTEEQARQLAHKIVQLRLFSESEGGFMRKTIDEERGDILVVPEITLYASSKGGRLDFSDAEKPELAKKLFEVFTDELRKSNLKIESGIFGEHMLVEIYNDGPVTILEEV